MNVGVVQSGQERVKVSKCSCPTKLSGLLLTFGKPVSGRPRQLRYRQLLITDLYLTLQGIGCHTHPGRWLTSEVVIKNTQLLICTILKMSGLLQNNVLCVDVFAPVDKK